MPFLGQKLLSKSRFSRAVGTGDNDTARLTIRHKVSWQANSLEGLINGILIPTEIAFSPSFAVREITSSSLWILRAAFLKCPENNTQIHVTT